MKRHSKPFSVEIKKSRVQGQRAPLAPRHLFATTPAEVPKVFQRDEPRVVPEPSATPRILPSIAEPMWSSSEPVAPARRKLPSVEANQGQTECNLTATASDDVKDAHAEAPASAKTIPQADNAPVDAEDALPVHDIQPAQGNGVKAKSRKPQKRAAETVEQEIESGPIPEAEMPTPSMESKVAHRRRTKRLAAAAQLPRHERWKGRLHPTAW
jgi:hypothetical protein